MKIGTGKGGVTQRFSCQQHYGPSKKRAVRERAKGKELRRRSLNSHMRKKIKSTPVKRSDAFK